MRYIDDAVMRRLYTPGTSDGIQYEKFWFHLTDVQFSTVAMITEAGKLVERVEYDAYGQARHRWGDDVHDHLANGADCGATDLHDFERVIPQRSDQLRNGVCQNTRNRRIRHWTCPRIYCD